MRRLTRVSAYEDKRCISIDKEGSKIVCSNFCTSCGKADCDYIRKALIKLAEYEDLEEQGKLPRLPCAIGDTVYEIFYDVIVERIVNGFFWKDGLVCGIDKNKSMFGAFSKTVFLTKEEAEVALKASLKEDDKQIGGEMRVKSIVTEYQGVCFFCGRPAECEHHLIFGNGLRKLAEEDGLKVPSCHRCHNMGRVIEQIHGNVMGEKLSKMLGQAIYEAKIGDREDFMLRYGKSFL